MTAKPQYEVFPFKEIEGKRFYEVGCGQCRKSQGRTLYRTEDGELRLVCKCGHGFEIKSMIRGSDHESNPLDE